MRLMKREPVVLAPQVRAVVCQTMAGVLDHQGAQIVDLVVAGKRDHLLVRFTPVEDPGTGVPGLSPAHARNDGLDPAPRYVLGNVDS